MDEEDAGTESHNLWQVVWKVVDGRGEGRDNLPEELMDVMKMILRTRREGDDPLLMATIVSPLKFM